MDASSSPAGSVLIHVAHEFMSPMKISAVPVCVPDEDRREILAGIDEILVSGQLTLGKHGRAFEERFAEQSGAPHAVAVNSGTSALEIVFRALDVAGKEVVVPTNTFFATPAAVLHAGGHVRFADVDPLTLCLDAKRLMEAITPETVGVVVVHIGGMIVPDIDAIVECCRARGLWLVEDAAHAHGASFNGRAAGSFGVAGTFSFYPTKVMTSGEGGMIITSDARIHEEALVYRDQGKAGFHANVHTRLGYNWRMSELHALVGLSQLKRLPEFVERRQRIAAIYDRILTETGTLRPVRVPSGSRSNYYKYAAFLSAGVNRVAYKQTLRQEWGVPLSGEVYELPCHLQPVFRRESGGSFPEAETACASHVCLPMSPTLTVAEAEYVATSVTKAAADVAAVS